MLTHKNIHNFIIGMKEKIQLIPSKTMLSLTTICFDIFVLEIWCSLLSGMKVVLANEEEQNNPTKINQLCLNYNVDIIQTTPSRYNILLSDENSLLYLKKLTDILVGGESLSKALLKKFQSLSNANIYNLYGPTETSVWSTIKNMTNTNHITIGSPISNTKIYILNNNLNIMPINVPGELYISGDGVSNGYWNREELTKEKFIFSPLHNEILYNTNDLAYINEKNELIHLGRTDFQVKLRGYRVELGEIEHKILSHPDIEDTIIIYDKRDFLICYYKSQKEVDPILMLDYITKDLPNYMAPSYYIHLEEIPLTPNGKIDRAKLPQLVVQQTKVEVASTNTEKQLSKIVCEILKKDVIDINTTFLELGIDSLDIINIQTLTIPYKWEITTQDFYKYPTIKKLSERIDLQLHFYLENEYSLPPVSIHTDKSIDEELLQFNKSDSVLGNVFLTGCTGFLGIHILHELIYNTNSDIYCLTRGTNLDHAKKRLINHYKFYFDTDISDLIQKRIYVVNGAIDKEKLGLSKDCLLQIKENISTFIHCAAIVGHYGDSMKYEDTNINGTKRIAEFAFNNKKRFIHISSLSVSGNYLVKQDNSNSSFTENNLYIGQHYTENVYVNSKLESEKIIFDLIGKGLDAKIIRLGIISGRYSDGVFQNNISENAFYSRIKSIVSVAAVTKEMLTQNVEFTPVDICAHAIVELSKYNLGKNKVFHLYNHNLYKITDLINELRKFDVSITVLDNNDFMQYIDEIAQNSPYLLSGLVNDFNHNNKNFLDYNYSVDMHSDITLKYLDTLNIHWPDTTNEYIHKLLNYMKKVNFI